MWRHWGSSSVTKLVVPHLQTLISMSVNNMQEYLSGQNYPQHTLVTRVIEGFETLDFRSNFDKWPLTGQTPVSEEGRGKVAGMQDTLAKCNKLSCNTVIAITVHKNMWEMGNSCHANSTQVILIFQCLSLAMAAMLKQQGVNVKGLLKAAPVKEEVPELLNSAGKLQVFTPYLHIVLLTNMGILLSDSWSELQSKHTKCWGSSFIHPVGWYTWPCNMTQLEKIWMHLEVSWTEWWFDLSMSWDPWGHQRWTQMQLSGI